MYILLKSNSLSTYLEDCRNESLKIVFKFCLNDFNLFDCFLNIVIFLLYRDQYPILLVANKVDLVHLRKVSESEGREMANRLNLPYMETSAKDPPQNIDGAFHEVNKI